MGTWTNKLLKMGANGESDQGISPLAAGVGGIVGASPLLGAIGEKPIVHDPFQNSNIRRMTMEELSRRARTGDVLITSKPAGSGWKILQYPLGSEFYHAQPVIGRRGGHGTTASAGQFHYPDFANMKQRELASYFDEVKRGMRGDHYPDVVLMRPDKPLTPEELKKFREVATRRVGEPYKASLAVKGWLKDLLVPKIEGVTGRSPPGVRRVCRGDVCSTLPAQTYWEAANRNVHQAKLPHEVMPVDFLREGSGFSPVGARVTSPRYTPKQMARIKMLSRAGIGAALGTGAYAVTDDPLRATALVGGLGIPHLVSGELLPRLYAEMEGRRQVAQGINPRLKKSVELRTKAFERGEKVIPSFGSVLNVLGSPKPEHRMLSRRLLTRTLPLAAGSGLGVYLLADKIRNAIKNEAPSPPRA